MESEATGEIRQVEEWSPELQKSRAYEQILLDIILGVLPPGARLDEHSLTRRYQLGLAGVRDALGRLSLEGLVQRRARSGTTVTPLDVDEVEQAFEIRGLLEPHGAALAAKLATPSELRAIQAAFDGAEKAAQARDYRGLVAMDLSFHRAVSIGSHNLTLARMIAPLNHKAARYWHHFMTVWPEHDRLQDVQRHLAVVSAIAEHDSERAREAMRRVVGVFPGIVTDKVDAPVRGGRA
jgi:DNA-binding GntR family transcriptional regulator